MTRRESMSMTAAAIEFRQGQLIDLLQRVLDGFKGVPMVEPDMCVLLYDIDIALDAAVASE